MTQFYFDGGFSWIKSLCRLLGQDVLNRFPAIAGEIMTSENIFDSQDELSLTVDGVGSFAFGETARLQSWTASRTQDHDWIFSDRYKAALLLAISETYSKGTDRINLTVVTGLPDSDWQRGEEFREEFKSSLRGTYFVRRNGYNQRVTVDEVRVTSQGWGPLFYHYFDDDGNPHPKPADVPEDYIEVGSLNIGGNTVECKTIRLTFRPSRKPKLETGKSESSTDDGVFTLLSSVKGELKKHTGIAYDDYTAMEALRLNGVRQQAKWVEIDLSRIRQWYAQQMISHCSTVWPRDEKNRLYALIVTGGGAKLVGKYLRGFHGNIKASNDPQIDPLLGYRKLYKANSKR